MTRPLQQTSQHRWLLEISGRNCRPRDGNMSLLERFEQKVQHVPESGCWLWSGYTCEKGYGIFWFDGGPKKAHRVSYEIYRDGVPADMVIDHLCRERSCVNPDHLRIVTAKENTHAAGSLAPAKRNADKTHCPKCGGEYSFNNRGQRICRACLRKYFRERQERKKLHRVQANG
jgi:hypothetical protein